MTATSTPASNLPAGAIRHGSSIGQPLTRRDGPLKVTGQARFSADNLPPGTLHAALCVARIAKGRVTGLDVAAAEAHPGVVAVMRPGNAPTLAKDPDAKDGPFTFRLDLLQNDRVRYANQPIAVVIAETLEAATEGARLLAPTYAAETPRIGLDAGEAFTPDSVGVGAPPAESEGDIEAGLAAASRTIAATYETPAQYHNAMEPHAALAQWDGDRLTLHMPTQALAMSQGRLAGLFGINPDDIHIESPYLGGGFGSKGVPAGPQVLACMAARLVGRPVKLVPTRTQMYGPMGHRGPTRQTLRLGADAAGKLTALDHHILTASSSFDDFFEPAGRATSTLYAEPRDRHPARGGAPRHRHPAVHARPRRGHRQRRPGERARRDGPRARHGPAGVPAGQLRRGRAAHRQAVLVEGPARVLPARRRGVRLGRAPAPAPPDPGQRRVPGRHRHGHRHLPGADLRGASPGRDPRRRLRHGGTRGDRHGPGLLDGARPDRRRRARDRDGRPHLPDGVLRPAECRHRGRLGPHRHGGRRDPRGGRQT